MSISPEHIQKIEAVCTDMLCKLTVTGEVSARIETDDADETLVVNIKSQDAKLLIGANGSHLQALQHIVRLLHKKHSEDPIRFYIDINGYKEEKEEKMKRAAWGAAKQAMQTGQEVELQPMNAYERRFVHKHLAHVEGIETSSKGEGLERRIVIIPS